MKWLLGILVILRADPLHAAVSFHREVAPIFQKSCNGCHRPGKEKGGLDLTTAAGVLKGGKHGTLLGAGNPRDSRLVDTVTGPEPEMPKDGEPLSARQIAVISQWIREGSVDDTPASATRTEPPVYSAPPVLTALTFSPGNEWLAVSGVHDVILLGGTNYQAIRHLLGDAQRIESFEFSPDGTRLAVAAGTPGVFGEIQIWDPRTGTKVPVSYTHLTLPTNREV